MFKSWVESTRLNGQPVKSLTIALEARGCSYARARKQSGKPRCTFCPFHEFTVATEEDLCPEKLAMGVRETIDAHGLSKKQVDEQIRLLKIYMGGSFFAPQELRPQERAAVLRTISEYTTLKRLFVESRPEHIRTERIKEARGILKQIGLEVAIGLETSDDTLRARTWKGFRCADFERAAKILADHNIAIAVYLLIKPVLMSEEEAKEDVLRSLRYLAELRAQLGTASKISARLEPFAIYPGMNVEPGHTPPALKTIAEIVHYAPPDLELFIGWNESEVGSAKTGTGSLVPTGMVKAAVDRFNTIGDRTALERYLMEGATA